MATPPSSKKTAKAGVKKIPIAKAGIKKAAKKIVLKTPASSAKSRSVTSKTKPAAVKKASPLRKVGSKVIKKTTAKKAKQVMAKGGLSGAKNKSFELEVFLKLKFSDVEKTAHQKKIVSGQTSSTVADLSKFNVRVANEHYKVKKEDSLEAILLALHLPRDKEKLNISPRVDAVFKEVSNYQDLLLLGDLATITQEKRPYSWISGAPTLSPEAQTALTTSLLGLTLKLTGTKLANFKLKLPGGKLRSKSRTEVLAYLALIQNIVDAMAGSKNWKKAAKDSNLDKMHADITKIVNDF